MKQDSTGMTLAIQEAQKAYERGEVPVGAVMMQNGTVVAAAGNEREARRDPCAHAEILAIQQAAKRLGRRRLQDCTLYVTLEPCPMCAGAAVAAGLNRIVFGALDEQKGCCGSLYAIPEDPAFGRTIPCDGPCQEAECKALLDAFFEEHRSGENGN